MSTLIGDFVGRHFRPRLLPALVRVAAIGAWDGRGLPEPDDDVEQAEILAIIAAERSVSTFRPTPAQVPPAADPQHPAAA